MNMSVSISVTVSANMSVDMSVDMTMSEYQCDWMRSISTGRCEIRAKV